MVNNISDPHHNGIRPFTVAIDCCFLLMGLRIIFQIRHNYVVLIHIGFCCWFSYKPAKVVEEQ